MSQRSTVAPRQQTRLSPALLLTLLVAGLSLFMVANARADLRNEPFTFGRFSEIAENIKPAVVNISAESKSSRQAEFFNWHPFFDEMPEDRRSQSQGTGVVISQEGHIVTNNHVVEDADDIRVKFLGSEKTYEAELLGTDPQTDVALIRVKEMPKGSSFAKLGDSESLRVGDWVMAVGHPFGLEHTVSVGVVSAKERYLDGSYDNFIQTDAVINPGNSGGPLINIFGEVVGINTAIYTRTGGSMGIGFAIPSNMVSRVTRQLQENGVVKRGYLGVSISGLDEGMAETLGIDEPSGALVREVVMDTPAAKAGIEVGDVIVEFNGKAIASPRDLTIAVGDTPVGSDATVKFYRNGRINSLPVGIALRDDGDLMAARGGPEPLKAGPRLGMSFETYDGRGNNRVDEGVIVTGVEPMSPAARSGLEVGDIIVKVNRQDVDEASDVARAVAAAETGDSVLFTVVRDQRRTLIMVRVD